ncbi:hypothetical protein AB0G00_34955 [Nocardia salmonicida]|uniref:hypothetical protein n=1 Tax=Nocardia salmonicida TaxID=53431 RepID=UPI0033D39D69
MRSGSCSTTGIFPALTEPHVELVTDRIERLGPDGIRTVDGTERRADVIVWATGFHAREFFAGVQITGRGGVDLHDQWRRQGRPSAFYGLAVRGFPNLYMIAGPSSFTPSNSNPTIKQHQARYITRCLALSADWGAPVEVTERAMARYLDRLDHALARTIWGDGAASAWWKSADGTITNAWPETLREFEHAIADSDPAESFAKVAVIVGARLVKRDISRQSGSGQLTRTSKVAELVDGAVASMSVRARVRLDRRGYRG